MIRKLFFYWTATGKCSILTVIFSPNHSINVRGFLYLVFYIPSITEGSALLRLYESYTNSKKLGFEYSVL